MEIERLQLTQVLGPITDPNIYAEGRSISGLLWSRAKRNYGSCYRCGLEIDCYDICWSCPDSRRIYCDDCVSFTQYAIYNLGTIVEEQVLISDAVKVVPLHDATIEDAVRWAHWMISDGECIVRVWISDFQGLVIKSATVKLGQCTSNK